MIDNTILLDGLALWRKLAGAGPFPSRSLVTARVLKALLRNTSLVKVIDGGRDYEYRIVGDAFVMAHGRSFQGRLSSEMEVLTPGFCAFVNPIFDKVVRDGEPVATRGWIERGRDSKGHVYCESIYLPLGTTESGVDHILIFAVYLRRDGIDHVAPAMTGSFVD